ncbi:hypothetical protein KSF78_0001649 [Schistosoma japonicum]|nr:hypothetical protein KSF78_0001649 [Schistosoma japonicum]
MESTLGYSIMKWSFISQTLSIVLVISSISRFNLTIMILNIQYVVKLFVLIR